jgi:hypothetical protein
VSFVGYLRPLVQGGGASRKRFRPVLALAGGFATSALVIYAIVWLTGAAAEISHISIGARLLIASGLILAAGILDSGLFGLHGVAWRRQTPRAAWMAFGPTKASLLWGLDAGLAFTTYRVTSLTWAGFAVTFLHLAPWWSGVAYGAAFVIPTVADILAPAPRDTPGSYFHSRYANLESRVRVGAQILLLALTGGAVTAAAVAL